MGWIYVLIAAVFEMIGVLGLNYYSKNRKLSSGLVYFGGLILSLVFLYMSFQTIQVSIAYTVWTGIGTSGAVIMNMIFFKESSSGLRIVSLITIIAGVMGLKIVS